MIHTPTLPPKKGYVEVIVDGAARYKNIETGELYGEETIPTMDKRVADVETQTASTLKLSSQMAVATKHVIQTATDLTDDEALDMPDFHKTWEEVLSAGVQLEANRVIRKGETLYRVVQAVTPQEHQPPDGEGMLAIYRPIDVTHAGTVDDPIPWVYGMDCETGLVYIYSGNLWNCVGDMRPCVWAPGTAGVWQWEAVS